MSKRARDELAAPDDVDVKRQRKQRQANKVFKHKSDDTSIDILNDDCLYTLFKCLVATDLRTAFALLVAYPRLRHPFFTEALRNWALHAVLAPLGAPIQYASPALSTMALYEVAHTVLTEYPTRPPERRWCYNYQTRVPMKDTSVNYNIQRQALEVSRWRMKQVQEPELKDTHNSTRHLVDPSKRVAFPIDAIRVNPHAYARQETDEEDDDTIRHQEQELFLAQSMDLFWVHCNSTEIGTIDVMSSTDAVHTLQLDMNCIHFVPAWMINARIPTVILEYYKTDSNTHRPTAIIGLRELLANATHIAISGLVDSTTVALLLPYLPTTLVHLFIQTAHDSKDIDWSPVNRLTQLETLYIEGFALYAGRPTDIQFNTLTQLHAIFVGGHDASGLCSIAHQLATLPHLKAVYLNYMNAAPIYSHPPFPIQIVDAPQLRILVIHGLDLPKEYPSILSRAPHLRILAIRSWTRCVKNVFVQDLRAPGDKCIEDTHKNIRYVDLYGQCWTHKEVAHIKLDDIGRNVSYMKWAKQCSHPDEITPDSI